MVPTPIPPAPILPPAIPAEALAGPSMGDASESGQACGFAACLVAVVGSMDGPVSDIQPKRPGAEGPDIVVLDLPQIQTPPATTPVVALPLAHDTSGIPNGISAAGSAPETPVRRPSEPRTPPSSGPDGGQTKSATGAPAPSPSPAEIVPMADTPERQAGALPRPMMANASPSVPLPDRIGPGTPAAVPAPEPPSTQLGARPSGIMPAAPPTILRSSQHASDIDEIASPGAAAAIAAALPLSKPAPDGEKSPGIGPAPLLPPSASIARQAGAVPAISPDHGPDHGPDRAPTAPIALRVAACDDPAASANGPRTPEPSAAAPTQSGPLAEVSRPRPFAVAPGVDVQRHGGGDATTPTPITFTATEPALPALTEGSSDLGLSSAGAGASTSLDLAVGQAPASTRAARPTAHPATGQVFVALARSARDGIDRIAIKLQPPELGRVDILIELGEDGRVQAVLAAERPATAEILQRDLRDLERALQRAGLAPEPGGLSVALRHNGQGGGQNAQHHGGAAPNTALPSASGGSAPAEAPSPTTKAGRDTGRLDIRV